MLKEKLHSLIRFPYEEKYRDQLELEMVSLNYRSERTIAFFMLVMQLFLILVFTLRPGSIFYSFRRLGYVIAYAVMALGLLVLLSLHRRAKNNWRLHFKLCAAFGILLSLWVCSISYLDALGDLSIVVYCSFLPMMAAFLILPPYILSILFIFTCILTNILVLRTPYGQENVFSTLVNSIFICLLSIVYSYRMYHARLTGIYDKIIIDQKNQQLEAANEKLDRLSMTDTLTTLGNRRYLEESVNSPLEKYGVHMGSLAVLLLDIDFFKQYNDRYGHQQGDVCLKTVASVLSSFSKQEDFQAVRYGGEEFVLVTTGLSAEEIMAKAEQIRMSVASTQISAPQKINTSVTVSIGVSYHASWKPGLLETAIEEADRALYRAKQNGRNKTILFTD
ncbi:MAG: GGDEF domain-containing protein [Blautia marasmi]